MWLIWFVTTCTTLSLAFTGDGTEDISCRMESNSWVPSEPPSGTFSADEAQNFYIRLREHFISYLVFPAVFCRNPNFPMKIGSVPPVVNPVIAGDSLYDTEFEKDSTFLKGESIKTSLNLPRSFGLISLSTNILEGWGIFHLKGGIHSFVWCSKTFLYDIRELRYK